MEEMGSSSHPSISSSRLPEQSLDLFRPLFTHSPVTVVVNRKFTNAIIAQVNSLLPFVSVILLRR